jgi:hypothetical protein
MRYGILVEYSQKILNVFVKLKGIKDFFVCLKYIFNITQE